MRTALIETAIGVFAMAWGDRGVCRFALPGRTPSWASDGGELAEPDGDLAAIPGMVRRYAEGEKVDFTGVPLDLGGVATLNRRAYAELLRIGYGETTTYGAIGRALGDATLARAVGTAMGRNPIPLLIPCHRVLGANGRPVGFSAPGGVTSKMKLLALEHAAAPTGQYAFGF